jgi:hypothetical protein
MCVPLAPRPGYLNKMEAPEGELPGPCLTVSGRGGPRHRDAPGQPAYTGQAMARYREGPKTTTAAPAARTATGPDRWTVRQRAGSHRPNSRRNKANGDDAGTSRAGRGRRTPQGLTRHGMGWWGVWTGAGPGHVPTCTLPLHAWSGHTVQTDGTVTRATWTCNQPQTFQHPAPISSAGEPSWPSSSLWPDRGSWDRRTSDPKRVFSTGSRSHSCHVFCCPTLGLFCGGSSVWCGPSSMVDCRSTVSPGLPWSRRPVHSVSGWRSSLSPGRRREAAAQAANHARARPTNGGPRPTAGDLALVKSG